MQSFDSSVVISPEDGVSSPLSRPNVFSFLDFRAFLRAHFDYRKSVNSKFSYAVMARLTGIPRSLLQGIFNGTRRLVNGKAGAISKMCGFTDWEANYFTTLVLWNQADDPREKSMYWNRLIALAPQSEVFRMKVDQQEILHRWYVLALLELVRTKSFNPNPAWIAKRFRNLISKEEIESTLAQLQRLGLLQKDQDGRFVPSHEIVIVDVKEVSPQLMFRYHEKNIPLGIRAMRELDRESREISSTSIGIPRDQIDQIKSRIREFRSEILSLANSSKNPEDVFQLNIQFFSLTGPVSEGDL